MTWAEHHANSERLAAEAEEAARRGDRDAVRVLYAKAAEAEEQALAAIDPAKSRTFGVTAVSAGALWLKGDALDRAQAVIIRALASVGLPAFAQTQLKELLQRVWDEEGQRAAGVQFLPQDVLVSVKGGQVIRGGAPLDLVVEKVKGIQSFFHRTAEMLLRRPYRKRGPAEEDIQQMCRPWVIQAQPGSYQFAVRIQRPAQTELFPDPVPELVEISSTFLSVLRASAEDPEGALPALVPDAEYRPTFVELARNLAPTGKTCERLEVRAADAPTASAIVLDPETRKEARRTLKKLRPKEAGKAADARRQVRGILRAVHLDRDWLDVVLPDGQRIHVKGVDEVVDDVIGPMVNRHVVVDVVERGPTDFEYRDIELEE